ncbi:hypothetical protein ACL02O_32930 [Micromonospora sp. MS34]|uniref:hypothetical protein n=1 Tax=Micromonospora sp. MS34 TaxID=3385971 RepID=UPI0039A381AA
MGAHDRADRVVTGVPPGRGVGTRAGSWVEALAPDTDSGNDEIMADGLILRLASDEPVSDEELAEQARLLKDHLNQLPGVDARELVEPAEPGTRDPLSMVIGVLTLAVFSYPTAKRATADVRHLAQVIRRYQERNKGKRLRMSLPDGTEIDVRDVSEKTLTEVIRSVAVPRQGTSAVAEKVDGE